MSRDWRMVSSSELSGFSRVTARSGVKVGSSATVKWFDGTRELCIVS